MKKIIYFLDREPEVAEQAIEIVIFLFWVVLLICLCNVVEGRQRGVSSV